MIKPSTVEYRPYQLELAGKALSDPSLIVLPTGLGKTIVALLVMVARMDAYPEGKVLMLSPTKPLVSQHIRFFKNVLALDDDEITMLSGEVSPANREGIWEQSRVIVSTPQVGENDLIARRCSLEDFVLLVFDEAHRGVGKYAYTYIAQRYMGQAKNPLILGITASPGANEEKVREVCKELGIQKVYIKGEQDPDVRPYIPQKDIEWITVKMPEGIQAGRKLLYDMLAERVKKLRNTGAKISTKPSKKELLALQSSLMRVLKEAGDTSVYYPLSMVAEVLKLTHGIELLETQGMQAFLNYIERIKSEADSSKSSKASKRLMSDKKLRYAIDRLKESGVEHPKLDVMVRVILEQLEKNPSSLIIVFTNYRDSARMVMDTLSNVEGIRAVRFVGQGSRMDDKGLSQREQVEILDRFSQREFNVLVATSVAEEGLDIPSTDLVVFYEPVPSEIRSIQRKGRTGRRHTGKVVVLITEDTKDVAAYWSSVKKEKKMRSNVEKIFSNGDVTSNVEKTLAE